jgi:hypothetical protein
VNKKCPNYGAFFFGVEFGKSDNKLLTRMRNTTLLTLAMFLLSSIPGSAIHQTQEEEVESVEIILINAVGSLIESAIDERQRGKCLEEILVLYHAQINPLGDANIRLVDYDLHHGVPIDTCGQALLSVDYGDGKPEYLFMIMKDGWYSRGKMDHERVRYFKLTNDEMLVFFKAYLSVKIGTEVTSLDSIPLYTSVRAKSAKYKKYIKEWNATSDSLIRPKWPLVLIGNGNRVRVFRGYIPLSDIQHQTRKGISGYTYRDGLNHYWEGEFATKTERRAVKTVNLGELSGILTSHYYQIGNPTLGYYNLNENTIWQFGRSISGSEE